VSAFFACSWITMRNSVVFFVYRVRACRSSQKIWRTLGPAPFGRGVADRWPLINALLYPTCFTVPKLVAFSQNIWAYGVPNFRGTLGPLRNTLRTCGQFSSFSSILLYSRFFYILSPCLHPSLSSAASLSVNMATIILLKIWSINPVVGLPLILPSLLSFQKSRVSNVQSIDVSFAK